jgi:hypothetical protein
MEQKCFLHATSRFYSIGWQLFTRNIFNREEQRHAATLYHMQPSVQSQNFPDVYVVTLILKLKATTSRQVLAARDLLSHNLKQKHHRAQKPLLFAALVNRIEKGLTTHYPLDNWFYFQVTSSYIFR